MSSGTTFNPNHVDVTNYYLMFGVMAGLPAVVLLIAILWQSFRRVGRGFGQEDATRDPDGFFAWCLGASLFGHAVTSISVSYFDQSLLFFWATIALIGSVPHRKIETEDVEENMVAFDDGGTEPAKPAGDIPSWKRY